MACDGDALGELAVGGGDVESRPRAHHLFTQTVVDLPAAPEEATGEVTVVEVSRPAAD
ncbi:hypothetical protein [Streptomyces sp. HUAS ZL42]|uniref:hypothetical protein n=1 Tax=Streptomyces sp. HUAS ZL42 TaxID=3231715 RepID=UPI00345ECF73